LSTLHALARAEVNIPRRGMRVCRYESFSHTGKRKVLLCALCGLERPEGVGVRKKPLNALSLARFARARRERKNIPSAEMREIIILQTLSAPDGARVP